MAIVGSLSSYDLRAVAYTGGSTGALDQTMLSQVWDVSKIPLPFQDQIGTGSASSSVHEWIKDKLRTPAANAWAEGASTPDSGTASGVTDIGDSANVTNVERLRNICQISAANVTTTFRSQAVAGNQVKSLAYQVMQRMREIRQDQELTLLSNTASVLAASEAAACYLGGYLSWVEDKTSPTQNLFIVTTGPTSTQGGYDTSTGLTVAATIGTTAAAISETNIRDAVEAIYMGGAQATTLMCRPAVKRLISQYFYSSTAKIASMVTDVGQGQDAGDVARGAVSVIVTDFGVVQLIANRLMGAHPTAGSPVYIYDPSSLSVDYLTPMRTTDAEKNGLTESRTMYCDYTLKVGNDQCVAAITNVSETAAVIA